MLDFLVNLEIFPTGIVLSRSDSPLRQVAQRSFDSLPPFVMRGLRDNTSHGFARGFTQNTGGLAGGVSIDFAARWILAGESDAG